MPSDILPRALSSIPQHLQQQVEPIREKFTSYIALKHGEETSPLLPIEVVCLFITYTSTRLDTETHQELASHLWHQHVQPQVQQRHNIHIYAASGTELTQDARRRLINNYYTAKFSAGNLLPSLPEESKTALVRSQAQGASRIYAIFGGQGNNKHYFTELRNIHQTYQPFLGDLLDDLESLLQTLSQDPRISHLYSEGVQVKKWLQDPESTPSADYLITAPLSFPLIGLLQLATLKAICMSLDGTPADFPGFFHGLAGHSQGVVIVAAVAAAETWGAYTAAARKAVTILFWIGARSQQVWRQHALAEDIVARLEDEGHGKASPMLSISNIEQRQLDSHLARLNKTLPAANRAHVALVNSSSNFVVSGPERTLAALISSLKAASARDAQSQARVPYSQRKPSPAIRFLPITVPCHCSLLDEAVPLIDEDLRGLSIRASELRVPVNNCHKGSALQSLMGRVSETTRSGGSSNLVPLLVRMITSEPVFWAETDFTDATHILDLGPGGTSGVGALTHRNVAGTGARVLIAGKLEKSGRESDLGSLYEVFSPDEADLQHAPPAWATAANLGSVVQTASGPIIATKLSRLLGLPPFLVAGMTPTTTHPEFVAAVMNAGYHVEFAAGGYHNAAGLRKALYQLRNLIAEPGRGITINVIYVSPKAIAWQIPLIRQLRAEDSPSRASREYITTLGMRHIAFKPGSVASIRQVVEIARRHPEFPVILQWTGGRGGGHHSAEDFHAPILETYAEIRACENIALVAGSGFGCADDVIPYLTGDWSLARGRRVKIPFDGVLFGSRVMTCAEALTSPGAKAAIAAAAGVDDQAWEGTYRGPTGGIVSVVSEMGEPIHVVATRGAQFWSEMDKTIFSLEKKKRGPILSAKRDYIIAKLNADFQRPWFGRKADGRSCDVADMTYGEVCDRAVNLMFIGRCRWIDPSYARFLADWILRIEERFSQAMEPLISDALCHDNPIKAVAEVKRSFPAAAATQVFSEDAHYFMQLCRRPGQKPVPFIPALDDDFETWFKKDSLWQSEDVEAVVGQDAGRTFILHGSVAARQTCHIDEPVADVLNGINRGVLQHMLQAVRTELPREEFLQTGFNTYPAYETITHGSADIHPDRKLELLAFLAGPSASWLNALLGNPLILRGQKLVTNPVRRLVLGLDVSHVEFSGELLRLFTAGDRLDVEICRDGNEIRLEAFTYVTGQLQPVSMLLAFEYQPHSSFAPISEVVHDRNERISAMYRQLWTSSSPDISMDGMRQAPLASPETAIFEDTFIVDTARVRAFNRAIGYIGGHLEGQVPMDFAIVAAWSPICKALLQEPVQGDVLNLVHLSNAYEMTRSHGTQPSIVMALGEELRSRAYVNAIIIGDSGKTVEVVCELRRNRPHAESGSSSGPVFMTVRSRFLFRGAYTDYAATFARKTEPSYEVKMSSKQDIAVIAEKPWLHLEDKNKLNDLNLTELTLEFHLQTFTKWSDAVNGRVDTSGRVFVRSEAGDLTPIAIVKHSHVGDSRHNNVVLSYLERHGRVVASERQHMLPSAASTHVSQLAVPASNEPYSRASGDFNPIHTSPLFADLVDLPGTITHGMYCSAVVRHVVEKHMADQDPRRIQKYDVSFVGMVLPNETLEVTLRHTAMQAGRMHVDIEVTKKNENGDGDRKVLVGFAIVAQPTTTVVFTGQGSQEKGMGMDLYATSPVARALWDKADAYFLAQFGVSILDIVRHNPTEIKVRFGGVRGRMLRQNYMAMHYETPASSAEGGGAKPERRPMFPEIHERSTSYTHFAQPALTIMEMAVIRDMQAHGVLDADGCHFAGHSLGEFAALASFTDFMPFENLLYFVFCRGMTMQSAVERDALGRSAFAMAAVDPSRVCKGFTEATLCDLVTRIQSKTGFFVEVVNLNIRNGQYVCAGDLRALDLLQRVCDSVKKQAAGSAFFQEDLADLTEDLIAKLAPAYDGIASASKVQLQRGAATVPLSGVDVPFHSSYLRPRMDAFRRVLLDNLDVARLSPEKLVGRYVPNVTGKPFELSREYFEESLRITGSERIQKVLEEWDSWVVGLARDTVAV
ncbi:beta subunit of fatty acid synthetase [Apiospora phragmitis]|uniref:Beta subunit of fatty acid synthetase n=1 Tax=Apiospora phragmitis TaxID=2905665 RepID=A0ABR1VYD6_9PEZI